MSSRRTQQGTCPLGLEVHEEHVFLPSSGSSSPASVNRFKDAEGSSSTAKVRDKNLIVDFFNCSTNWYRIVSTSTLTSYLFTLHYKYLLGSTVQLWSLFGHIEGLTWPSGVFWSCVFRKRSCPIQIW